MSIVNSIQVPLQVSYVYKSCCALQDHLHDVLSHKLVLKNSFVKDFTETQIHCANFECMVCGVVFDIEGRYNKTSDDYYSNCDGFELFCHDFSIPSNMENIECFLSLPIRRGSFREEIPNFSCDECTKFIQKITLISALE